MRVPQWSADSYFKSRRWMDDNYRFKETVRSYDGIRELSNKNKHKQIDHKILLR